MELALEAGAEDLATSDETFIVDHSTGGVPRGPTGAGGRPASRRRRGVDRHGAPEHGRARRQKGRAVPEAARDVLEEHDDVQNVYANLEIRTMDARKPRGLRQLARSDTFLRRSSVSTPVR